MNEQSNDTKELDNNLDSKKQKIAQHFTHILEELGLNTQDPSIIDTPLRVAKMLVNETCNGLFSDPPEITTFELSKETSKDLIVIEDIPFNSLCEHHFQPFVGTATIAYIPNDYVMGLSKGARILDYFASRPQLQERLTSEVADYLYKTLDAKGVMVMIRAEHFCMKVRGVKKHGSSTLTTATRGEIDKNEVVSSIQLARK